MNEQLLLLLGIVVKSRLDGSHDVVRLEAHDIVQKAAELVSLRLHLDLRTSITAHRFNVLANRQFQLLHAHLELIDKVFLL